LDILWYPRISGAMDIARGNVCIRNRLGDKYPEPDECLDHIFQSPVVKSRERPEGPQKNQ